MQTSLIAHIKDEEAIDALDGFVFRDNQPTDIALELLKSLGRKHGREKGSIVLDNVRNFNQWEHMLPPETSTGGFLEAFYRFGALKGGVNLSDRCKSRVTENDAAVRLTLLRMCSDYGENSSKTMPCAH